MRHTIFPLFFLHSTKGGTPSHITRQMSFNRLNYDTDTYTHTLRQSVGPGDYMVATPQADCATCLPVDSMQSKNMAAYNFANKPAVDISSDLLGITRRASNCPNQQYFPTDKTDYQAATPVPDCKLKPNEQTRLSNPPSTLRGSGWNRWEWLCRNPQENVIPEFEANIANRIVVKDNHRPFVQRPLEQRSVLPPLNESDDVYIGYKPSQRCGANSTDYMASTTWKPCNYYDTYSPQQ